MTGKFAVIPLVAALSLSSALLAQDGPIAAPIPQTVPDAADTPWPGGAIRLDIDATDVQRGVFRVTETIPLAPGTKRITLQLPAWLPGHHGPRGPLAELADLRFTVDGKPASWRRDPVEVFAFHIDLPEGGQVLEARFVHTSPLESDEGRIAVTREMSNLQWEKMSLYPAGHYVRRIRVAPTVTFPAGWQAATALDGQTASGDRVTWAETDYETLVDSPIFAGKNFRRWTVAANATMDVIADEPELLEAKPENVARVNALFREASALFGPAPYDRYHLLVALTDRMGGIGLEHLRSSENQLEPKNFTEWDKYDWDRNVLAHELVHAWNGKYRRPALLWTPDYRTPMQDNLLWVYEGQTQFWGMVLAARSGLQAKPMVLGMLATSAGRYSEQAGRAWRSVEDTTFDPVFAARKPKPFSSLTRDEDYYNEGALVWLEADQVIRSGTGGRKGLDDFARSFFGHAGGGLNTPEGRVKTYGFDDVVAGLNAVYRHDWAAFLRQRIETPGQPAPIAGIERAGYRLIWKEEPNPYEKGRMEDASNLNLTHSLGLVLSSDGTVTASQWDGPAFKAGVVSGAKIVAVNGVAYDADGLKKAITAAKGGNGKAGTGPIELLVKRGNRFTTVPIAYTGGLRWPWIEPAGGGTAGLDRLLAARAR